MECDIRTLKPDGGVADAERFGRVQKKLLNLHNERRSSEGMESLELDGRLCDYAQKHARIMCEKGRMFHSDMERLQEECGAEVVGENIAWGQETEDEVMSSWMCSPTHTRNVLGSSYRKAGLAVEKDKDGRNYWCAVFSN